MGLLLCIQFLMTTAQADLAAPSTLESDLANMAAAQLRDPNGLPVRDIKMAFFYEGLHRLWTATGDPAWLTECYRFGNIAGWHPGGEKTGDSGLAVSQVWLQLALYHPDWEELWQPTLERITGGEAGVNPEPGALFALLPVMAKLQMLDPSLDLHTAIDDLVTERHGLGRHAMDFAGLALALEVMSRGHQSRPVLAERLVEWAAYWADKQQSDGLWAPDAGGETGVAFSRLGQSSLVVLAFAIGMNEGILDRGLFLPAVQKALDGAYRLDISRLKSWEVGVVLASGAELLKLSGAKTWTGGTTADLEEVRGRLLEEKHPMAFARFVPQRKDDLAWENDRMAYRIYGPALVDSGEDSGVDAWIKRVDYPILNKWYYEHFNDISSYHDDTGEGFDGYKVGPRRGCGGAGIWKDGELLTSNVYDRFEIYWTNRYLAHFSTWYTYPDGTLEKKDFRLRLGEALTEVSSQFTREGEPVAGLSVAVGLTAQTEHPEIRFDLSTGEMSLVDKVETDRLLTRVAWDRDRYPDVALEIIGKGNKRETLVVLETEQEGFVTYGFGFSLLAP